MDPLNEVTGFLIGIALLLIGLVIIFWLRAKQPSLKTEVKLFIVAFALRFAISFALYSLNGIKIVGDEDGSGWYAGVLLADRWTNAGMTMLDLPGILMEAFEGVNRGYSYLLGVFCFITNSPYRLPVAALSCFSGAMTVVVIYWIAEETFSTWVAVRAGWWSCVMPSMLIWSAQTLKEPIVILLEVLIAYLGMQLRRKRFRPQHVVVCLCAMGLLVTLRFYAAYLSCITLAVCFALPRVRRFRLTPRMAFYTALVLVPVLTMSWSLLRNEEKVQEFDGERLNQFKGALASTSNTGVQTGLDDMTTAHGFGIAVLIGGAHLLLAPFPWQWGSASLRMLMTIPEVIVWWILFFRGVVPGLVFAIRDRFFAVIPLLVIIFGLGLLYSVTFGNIGLVYRQRAQLLPSLLIFAMAGFEQRALRRAVLRRLKLAKRAQSTAAVPLLQK
jgi:hypothetical protein